MEHTEREQLIDWLCEELGCGCYDEYNDEELLEMKDKALKDRPHKKAEILFVRNDPDTQSVAALKVKFWADFEDDEQVVLALEKAITDWVNETDRGYEEWEGSSEDFNIGDLSSIPAVELAPFLSRHGIRSYEIDIISGIGDQSYDRVLVNRNKLKERG